MDVLISFFVKYLLAPILVIVFLFVLNSITKIKKTLNLKALIVFVLLSSIILVLPSLFGLLRNEFVWGGLFLTIISYLILGVCFSYFFKSKLFKKLGLNEHNPSILLVLFLCVILSSWIFFLLFSWLSKLPYSLWVMFNVSWVMIPVLYGISRSYFLNISTPFYKHWIIGAESADASYWENRDNFKFMLVTVRIKRRPTSKEYASLSVRLPLEAKLGVWFDRFVEDQNVRFPRDTIETQSVEGNIAWIFYTSKWFKVPLFLRVLDPEKDSIENKIKNKHTIYIRRTTLKKGNHE